VQQTSKLIHDGKTAKFSLKERVQLGLVSGLIAGIVMALVILALQAAELMPVPYFYALGTLVEGVGVPYYVGMYGLIWHLGLGVIWGIVFVLVFHTYSSYSVTKGLAVGGLQLLILALAFTFISTPQLGGTILTVPLSESVTLLIDLTIAFASYGAAIGYLTKKHKIVQYGRG
jgi:uncharacterized membrane protein YagU involved in acid resistance